MVSFSKRLSALSFTIAVTLVPTITWAQSKPNAGTTKTEEKSQTTASSDLEENRRQHMQKSKENNEKKGAE